MRRELTAIIEREGDGYVALCPEVDVASQGDSAAAAQENLQEAIALFFETASAEEIERRGSGGVYLVVGAVALVLSWNKADIRRFSEVVGSLGLSALVGANPIMVMVTIVGLAKCSHESRHGAEFNRILSGGGRGMVGTTALLGASRLMPAPAWMTVMLGVVSYLVAAKLYDQAEPKAEEVARIVRNWFGSQEWTSSCPARLRGGASVGTSWILIRCNTLSDHVPTRPSSTAPSPLDPTDAGDSGHPHPLDELLFRAALEQCVSHTVDALRAA